MNTETLSWTLPTVRVDGSPLNPSDIASSDIFDTIAGVRTQIGSVPGPTATFTTDSLSTGDHTFDIVIDDTAGNHSDPSNPVPVTVQPPLARPAAVTDLRGVLNTVSTAGAQPGPAAAAVVSAGPQ